MSLGYLDRLKRAFVLPGAVDPSWVAFGMPNEEWTPKAYGEYIATSNAVYACVNRRAQAVASVPLTLVRGEADVETGPLRQLLDKVNPFWTFNRLMHMTEQSLSLWGECYWFLDRGASAAAPPREIWWARPDRVKVYPHPERYISHFGYEPETGAASEILFQPTEVLWLRYPNPMDEWSGLSPLAAARLAADTMSAAMKSNRNLFAQGIQMGGIISPKSGQPMMTDEQGKKFEEQFNRKFRGVDQAHRWAVMKLDMQFQSMQMTPKDAEFIELHRLTLEDVCRSFGVPLDLIGGQRTYANAAEARHAFWADTIVPELMFLASEITEQLVPMFTGQATDVRFDTSGVEALQENEDARQQRIRSNFQAGLLTYDDAREALGLDPLPNGKGNVIGAPFNTLWIAPDKLLDQTAASVYVRPETEIAVEANADGAELPKVVHVDQPPRVSATPDTPLGVGKVSARIMEYGSDEHRALWDRAVQRTDRHETLFRQAVESLFRDQRKSVLAKLTGRTARAADPSDLADEPFDLDEWVKKARVRFRPLIRDAIDDAGLAANASLGSAVSGISWDLLDPNVIRFLEGRTQRFAERVNETTWSNLKASLSDGVDSGETIDELAGRVNTVMGDRIRSSAETIARTEVIGASNGGTLESWQQSGVVVGKRWLAALDNRTRETHVAAHNQVVGIDEMFLVGGHRGPHPGDIGAADEDVNCRCSMTAVLDVEMDPTL